MRRILSVFIVSSIMTSSAVGTREGWVVIDTKYTFPVLEVRLEAGVKTEHMGIVTSASASQGAKAAGFEIPGNKVFGVF